MLFFFQAEDGIRDIGVTGVQTCALPICARRVPTFRYHSTLPQMELTMRSGRPRSEERRVGKECRSRGGAEQQKKGEAHLMRAMGAGELSRFDAGGARARADGVGVGSLGG